MNTDLEKEVELASDLQQKLDNIEGKKTKRTRKTKSNVSQEIVTPYDKVVNGSYVTQLESTKNKVDEIEKSVVTGIDYRHPDPVKHKYISFAKSAVRIAAGIALCSTMTPMLWYAGALLILAEILGIVEELV